MPLPPESRCSLTTDLSIYRLLTGMWQISGAHGKIDPRGAIAAMFDYFDAGFTTWDLADHYGPAEDFVGEFLNQLSATRGSQTLAQVQTFTKWVPRSGPMTRQIVEANVDRSRRRMGVPSLDLLQFHWWDYCDRRYVDALRHLVDLKGEGSIRHLGLTNFDTDHLCFLLDHGIPIITNQVQFSLVDQRPLMKLVPFCRAHDVHLLAYGALCGGLLSETYLNQPEPHDLQLRTASLRKYKRMIDTWGGWELFQELLRAVAGIAEKHNVTLANVAVRWVLEQSAVAGVIVGARLGVQEHRVENQRVFEFRLDELDYAKLRMVCDRAQDLYRLIGDCGDEYRQEL